MGGSDSKEPSGNQSPFMQNDGLLKLLDEAAIKKENEYKESQKKLTQKLKNSQLAQKEAKDSHSAGLLNLKYDKLQLKLKKCESQYEAETKFIAEIRKIYSDQKEQVRVVENERTIQVANLNLDIVGLNVKIDNLTQQIKDREDLHKANEQQYFIESCAQRNIIAELKKKEEAWKIPHLDSVDLDVYNREVNRLKLEKQALRKEHQDKYEALSRKNLTNEAALLTLRTSNSSVNVAQSRLQQEIMFLKTENQEFLNRQQNDETKYKDFRIKYKREEQSNKDLRKEISALNVLLTGTVKICTLQQRGTFLEIKKSLHGLKVDLQFLIPNLNERTIPTLLDGNKEMTKLNVFLARSQENLDKVIEYQGNFDILVNSKQPMTGMEALPNFLSGVELPCSFLHLKFLPLFRIMFSTSEKNYPRPLGTRFAPPIYIPSLINRNTYENQNRSTYQQKNKYFTPTFQNQKEGNNDSSESTRQNTNANYRGRGRGGANNIRRPKQNKNRNVKTNNTVDEQVSAHANDVNNDSDCESSSGVTLTVLTGASTSGATEKFVEDKMVEEKTDCVICGGSLKSRLMPVHMLEPCMHKYHRSCINDWFESNTECPECAMED